ncbi:conserved hypothetical protein [Candidatus Carsonella ruddii PV]|uniref:tRNA-2-methylthio-N(6)-dimethylallyladenosine synthase n=1 Tax=Carsonella ruddii (strain PV) TaxID=387662 RepID=Q05FP4_CARRP|nr:MiaB/RimO family radical SAM methylthiotransferase [Candidatus Carsonella ruddii]BAF35127.1 conserved hypothetical protein [Candidatus Carsonella ruddii PV]
MFNFINLYIKTLGCNINTYISSKIIYNIKYFKIKILKNFLKSNLLILNSCVVRKNPQIKILKELKKWFFIKKYKKIIIILTGCLTEFEKINSLISLKIDIVINSLSYIFIKKILNLYLKTKKKILLIKKKNNFNIKKNILNYISIMKGCNHSCTYCIIPQTKGKEFYYSFSYIFNYIINNIKKKTTEITLLGQNVNSYYNKNVNFNSLIFNISKIKNIKRINFLSSNIIDFNKNFYNLYKNVKKISNHIHLPIQSGSNLILKKMNRKYNLNHYICFIKKIQKIKFTTFSTDIIVSFPNENFFDFDQTLKVLKKIKFLDIYYFLYSKLRNTISFNFKENSFFVKKFKLFIFQKSIIKNYYLLNNRVVRILVIGYISKNIFIGKMDNLKLVFFEYYKYNIIGKFINVKIIKIKKNIFLGLYENIYPCI